MLILVYYEDVVQAHVLEHFAFENHVDIFHSHQSLLVKHLLPQILIQHNVEYVLIVFFFLHKIAAQHQVNVGLAVTWVELDIYALAPTGSSSCGYKAKSRLVLVEKREFRLHPFETSTK